MYYSAKAGRKGDIHTGPQGDRLRYGYTHKTHCPIQAATRRLQDNFSTTRHCACSDAAAAHHRFQVADSHTNTRYPGGGGGVNMWYRWGVALLSN